MRRFRNSAKQFTLIASVTLAACTAPSGRRLAPVATKPTAAVAPSPSAPAEALPESCRDVQQCLALADAAKGDSEGPGGPTISAESVARANHFYWRACELGGARGCQELANSFSEGRGVEKRPECSLRLDRRACELGSMEACAASAFVLMWSSDVATDLPLALTLNQKACDGGVMRACSNLSHAYRFGSGTAKDEARAAQLLRKVCQDAAPSTESGGLVTAHLRECFTYAEYLLAGVGVPKDEPRAVQYFEDACENNVFEACTAMGTVLLAGKVVPRDMARGAELVERACANGAQGCVEAAALFRNGTGVQKDLQKAAAFEWVAITQLAGGCRGNGIADACEQLVKALSAPGAKPLSPSEAAEYLVGACDMGNVSGCRLAAQKLVQGNGLARDPKRAAKLEARAGEFGNTAQIKGTLERACETQGGLDCYLLGVAYRHGRKDWNVPKDNKTAQRLLGKGCPSGAGESLECQELTAFVTEAARDQRNNDPRPCDAAPLRPQKGTANER